MTTKIPHIELILRIHDPASNALFTFCRTVLEFGSTISLNEGALSLYPKGCVSIAISRTRRRWHTVQVKRFSGDHKKDNIGLLVKLHRETPLLIALIGNSGFECFVRGTPETDDENEKE